MSVKQTKTINLNDRTSDDHVESRQGKTTERVTEFSKECSHVNNSNRSKCNKSSYNRDESNGHALTHLSQDNMNMLHLMSTTKFTELMGSRCFNTCFRFFPPLMFLRWSLDIWLILCEAILALLTDHNRVAYKSLQVSKKIVGDATGKSTFKKQTFDSCDRSEEPETSIRAQKDDSKKPMCTTVTGRVTWYGPRVSTPRISDATNEKDPVVTNSNGRQDKTAISVHNGLPLVASPRDDGARQKSFSQDISDVVFCLRLFLLYLTMACAIPVLRRAVIILSHLSFKMHSLAGLDEFDDQDERSHRVFLYKHLVRQLPVWLGRDIVAVSVRRLGPEEWLIGHVIVRGIREMSKYPCLKSNFLTAIANKSRRHSVMETAKALVMQIQEESFVDLPSYLASDEEYEEGDDSDYDESDDSSSEERDTEEGLEDEAMELLVSMCKHSDQAAICEDIIKMNDSRQTDFQKKQTTQQKILQLMGLLKLRGQDSHKVRENELKQRPASEELTRKELLVEEQEEPLVERVEKQVEKLIEEQVEEQAEEQVTEEVADFARQGELLQELDSHEYRNHNFTHPTYEQTISAQGDE